MLQSRALLADKKNNHNAEKLNEVFGLFARGTGQPGEELNHSRGTLLRLPSPSNRVSIVSGKCKRQTE